MLRIKFAFLSIYLVSFAGWSQNFFISQVNDQSRVYLYASSGESQTQRDQSVVFNKPLFIIVHPNSSNPQEIFQSQDVWRAISSEVNLVFPRGRKDTWDCRDSSQLKNDALFLTDIISTSFSNFKIDRNRVYIITFTGNTCLGDAVKELNPGSISQVVSLPSNQSGSTHVIREIERLLASGRSAETSYSLYQRPQIDVKPDPMDLLKKYSWHQRWVVSIHTGGLFMLQGSGANSDDTYANLGNHHSFTGIEVTKWMNDSMAWFFDISRLKIPMSQETSGSIMTISGGMVMPVTLGFKYRLVKHNFYKPYVLLGTGPLQVMAIGGRILSSSSTSPGNIRDQTNSEMRLTFQTTIGAGLDMRFGTRIVLGGQFRYLHSAKFEAAGSIDSVRALIFNFSAGYIINANNERSLKALLNK